VSTREISRGSTGVTGVTSRATTLCCSPRALVATRSASSSLTDSPFTSERRRVIVLVWRANASFAPASVRTTETHDVGRRAYPCSPIRNAASCSAPLARTPSRRVA
jgi:hypothetical protein